MNAPHCTLFCSPRCDGAARPDPGRHRSLQRRHHVRKVNLGVGVYYDDTGKVPVLECVRRAESGASKARRRGYLPIDGLAAYDKAVQELVFGTERCTRESSRCKRSAAPARSRSARIS